MSANSEIVNMRLNQSEIDFLEKNHILYSRQTDKFGDIFSVNCSQLKEKFCNC